jgi:hypothetical protein
MPALGPLSFAAPLALLGLLALPLLWRLLRATPPAPKRALFPPLRLLHDAPEDAETPHHAPWWLIALRLLIAALVVIGLSQPVWTPPGAAQDGDAPLLLVIDDGWAASPNWPTTRREAERRLRAADAEGRLAAIAFTASGAETDIRLDRAALALQRLDAASPRPWPADRAALAARIDAARAAGDLDGEVQVRWLSDGVETPGAEALSRALSEFGAVRIALPEEGRDALGLASPELTPDGLRAVALRADASTERAFAVSARDGEDRVLARAEGLFQAGESEAGVDVALPLDLRNRIASLRIDASPSAGAVRLTGDRWRRPRIGLLDPPGEERLQLLSELHYVRSALAPRASLTEGDLETLLADDPAGLVMVDEARTEAEALTDYVENGGLLIRFAGPRLAARSDALIPMPLREGGRLFGGALNWEDPQTIAAFGPDSPFAGLEADASAVIRRQVLAEPSGVRPDRVWARLEDGTPLVTAERHGRGWIVLFHVTASPDWSDLPLSGLFPAMLERVLGLADGAPSIAPVDGAWTLDLALRADGRTGETPVEARPVPADAWADRRAAPASPPGLYRLGPAAETLNILGPGDSLAPLPDTLPGAVFERAGGPGVTALAGVVLATALILLTLDALIALALAGRLPFPARSLAGAALAIVLLPLADAAAQEDTDAFAESAALEMRFAYVLTGDAEIDRMSRLGLIGISRETSARSAVEPGDPMAVDIETDEILFFPLIYWPVTLEAQPLSPEAAARVSAYMQAGGLILFDTQDGDVAGLRAGAPHHGLLAVLESIETPALAPIPGDHVLTRSFFLLQDFPGRYNGRDVWVEANPAGAARDGTSGLVIGSHDWASAWAINEDGLPAAPVDGGDFQREMARRFGINLAMYALTGNYKADQVHAAEILERLGQ